MVFGFRSPVTEKILSIENELSGLEEDVFLEQFESAGGIWLSVPPGPYYTYDGNHLDKESAIRYSVALAEQIKKHLPK